ATRHIAINLPIIAFMNPPNSFAEFTPPDCGAHMGCARRCEVTGSAVWSEKCAPNLVTKSAVGSTDLCRYGRARRSVDYFAIQQGHHTFQVLDLFRREGVEVPIPDSEIGFFAYLKSTNLVFEKHLARTPCGVAAEGCVYV